MSHRQQHVIRAPYNQLLTALRKIDLLRLSLEFRLSTEGSVVTLRNRLRDYLNLHRDTVYRNPRYTALCPRHRRAPAPRHSPSPPNSPTTLSYRSSSPEGSFDSWNGLDDAIQGHPQVIQQPLVHPPVPPMPPNNPAPHYNPSPSPSDSNSDPGSLPPDDHPPVARKFFLSLPSLVTLSVFSILALCSLPIAPYGCLEFGTLCSPRSLFRFTTL